MNWQELANSEEIAGVQRSVVLGLGSFGAQVCIELLESFNLLDSLYGHHGTRITDLIRFVQVLDPRSEQIAEAINIQDLITDNTIDLPVHLRSRREMFNHFKTSASNVREVIRHEIEQVSRDALRPSSDRNFVNVYIVASLCEVAGSAGMWSLGSLCRQLVETIESHQIRLIGVCGISPFSRSGLWCWEMGNAYVALKEIQSFSDGAWNLWGDSQIFVRGDNHLFDSLYLFTREKQSGLYSGSLDELVQTIKILLNTFVLTSADRYVDHVLLDDFGKRGGVRVSACGASAVVIPIKELYTFNSRRLIGKLIQESVLDLTDESLEPINDYLSEMTGQNHLLSHEKVEAEICAELQLEHRAYPYPGLYWPTAITFDPLALHKQFPISEWPNLIETYHREIEDWENTIMLPQIRENAEKSARERCQHFKEITIRLLESTNDGLPVAVAFLKETKETLEGCLGMLEASELDVASTPNPIRERLVLDERIRNRPSILGIILQFSLLGILVFQTLVALFPSWEEATLPIFKSPLLVFIGVELVLLTTATIILVTSRQLLLKQFQKTLNQYTLLHKHILEGNRDHRIRDVYEMGLDWTRQSLSKLKDVIDEIDSTSEQLLNERIQDSVPKSFIEFPVADLARCQELYNDIIPDSRELSVLHCLRYLDFSLMVECALSGDQVGASHMIVDAMRRFVFDYLPHPRMQKVEYFIPLNDTRDLANLMWNCAVPWIRAKPEKAYEESQVSFSIASSILGSQSRMIEAFRHEFDSFGLSTIDPFSISLLRQVHGLPLDSLYCWSDLKSAYQALGSDTQYLHLDSEWAEANLPPAFPDDSEARSDFRFPWHPWNEQLTPHDATGEENDHSELSITDQNTSSVIE